jgi:hypothetical protein
VKIITPDTLKIICALASDLSMDAPTLILFTNKTKGVNKSNPKQMDSKLKLT